jgi:hypothetical protein
MKQTQSTVAITAQQSTELASLMVVIHTLNWSKLADKTQTFLLIVLSLVVLWGHSPFFKLWFPLSLHSADRPI